MSFRSRLRSDISWPTEALFVALQAAVFTWRSMRSRRAACRSRANLSRARGEAMLFCATRMAGP